MTGGGTNPLARLAALLAVVGAIAAVGLVFATSLGGDSGGDQSTGSETTDEAICEPTAEKSVKRGFFKVDEADVFADIATKTCVDVEVLVSLNEDIDPNALQLDACVNLDSRLKCEEKG